MPDQMIKSITGPNQFPAAPGFDATRLGQQSTSIGRITVINNRPEILIILIVMDGIIELGSLRLNWKNKEKY